MNIYIFILLSFIFLRVIVGESKTSRINKEKIYLYGGGTILFFIHAFKNPYIFLDTPSYAEAYQYICSYGLNSFLEASDFILKSEIGYAVLMWIVSFISENVQTIFIITSFIIVGGYLYSIKKYSAMPWLSLLIFLLTQYYMSMFVLRQFIAMAICFVLLDYVVERKFLKFFFGVLIAFSMHQTAIIFFPLYFLYPIPINKKFFLYMFLFIAGLIVIANSIYSYVGVLLVGYESYLDNSSGGTNFKGALLLIMIFIFYVFLEYRDIQKAGYDKLFFIALCLGLAISIAGTGLVATSRLNLYYSGLLYLIIPNFLSKVKSPQLRFCLSNAICLFFLYFFIRDLPKDYLFFWE